MSEAENNLVGGIKFFFSVIAMLANLIAIGAALGAVTWGNLSENTNRILYLLLLGLVLMLLCFIWVVQSKIRFYNLLMLIAQRGHLHTLRMLLLVRNGRKGERKCLCDGSADFTFHLEKKTDTGKSTVRYHHIIEAKRKILETFCFSTWLFGDEGIPPEIEETRVNAQAFWNGSAQPVDILLSKFANHKGIYKFDWILTKEDYGQKPKRSDITQFDLKYFRREAFAWDGDDIFVIYPRSFLEGIKSASISVFVEPEDSQAISEITITELSQGLRSTVKGPYRMEKQENKDEMCFYSTQGKLKINERNVYVVTIHLK